jgi:outer membrane protein OmpA-like peptidoglycan-associated protein
MFIRPLRIMSRLLLAASAVGLGVGSVNAQQAPSTAAAAPGGINPSRIDVFLGYSYFGAHGQVKPAGISYSSINAGAMGSGAYYFNKNIGAEGIFAAHPNGNNDDLYTISGGPIFRLPLENFTLFAHGLFGAGHLDGPNSNNGTYYEPFRWGPTITAGGGMDYALPFFDNRFSLRLFQTDYRWIHTNYGPPTTIPTNGVLGGRANLSGVELSTGIVAHWGHIIPPPPVTYSCAASPATVYPGDPITVTGTAGNLNPKKAYTYSWTADGGTISGNTSTATIDTKNAAPGNYTAKGHIAMETKKLKPGESADCTASYTVKQFEPPTISCSASPSTVSPGDSATITATGVSPQNRPLTYSYSASAGSVSGTGPSATLNTAGAAPGTITVTCNVVDDKGQTASSTTTVTVSAPPPPPAPTTSTLCTASFERDKRRPARVDNEAKACLDDIALKLQSASDAKLAVVGNATSDEKAPPKKGQRKKADLASERAVNVKDYLVTEKGIDASRISVYTGTDDAKTVTTTLVPAGATLSTTGLTPVDESAVKAVPRTPPARKRK